MAKDKKKITKPKKSNAGRKPVQDNELDIIFRKLEPHLRSGKTLNKALLLAQIPKTTVYKYYGLNDEFTEKIDAARAYTSVLVNDFFFRKLADIMAKQNEQSIVDKQYKEKKITRKKYDERTGEIGLSAADLDFMKWYATNSHATREEYGNRVELTGKDSEPLVPRGILDDQPIATILKTYEAVMKTVKKAKGKRKGA